MKDSEVLKEAREMIANGGRFICWAISKCNGGYRQKADLINWISSMLGPYGAYGTWLEANYPELAGKYTRDRVTPRLQWLDWMIAYCEAEEAREAA